MNRCCSVNGATSDVDVEQDCTEDTKADDEPDAEVLPAASLKLEESLGASLIVVRT